MIVGVVSYRFDHYSYTRNIINCVPGVEYRKTKDFFAQVNAGAHRVNSIFKKEVISTFDLNNQFYDFNLSKINLLHLYNGISYGRTPWVSTFETILPRFRALVQRTHGKSPRFAQGWTELRAIESLAGSSCKQLIAMSKCAANMEREILTEFSGFKGAIEEKLVVMLPPQEILVSQYSDKHVDLHKQIKFMFVGNEFFRKGGAEIIDTLNTLRDQDHYDIELIIVSSLLLSNYAVTANTQDIQRTLGIIQDNQTWIKYFPHLPNSEVLELMKGSHIGLLPTHADSFGYSMLEFQGAGCPVISTDVRALPEINNNSIGWIIDVPKNQLGEAIYTTEEDRLRLSQAIRTGIAKAVHEIFNDRSIVATKSDRAISAIKQNHSTEKFAEKMKSIYLNAIY
jgi:glycosyltransferase involved in cell wall biosynthesis